MNHTNQLSVHQFDLEIKLAELTRFKKYAAEYELEWKHWLSHIASTEAEITQIQNCIVDIKTKVGT